MKLLDRYLEDWYKVRPRRCNGCVVLCTVRSCNGCALLCAPRLQGGGGRDFVRGQFRGGNFAFQIR